MSRSNDCIGNIATIGLSDDFHAPIYREALEDYLSNGYCEVFTCDDGEYRRIPYLLVKPTRHIVKLCNQRRENKYYGCQRPFFPTQMIIREKGGCSDVWFVPTNRADHLYRVLVDAITVSDIYYWNFDLSPVTS